ncbi:MAG: hypothetical protein PHD83_02600 [Caldisericia bacterium]|nr:hypothetical protein [Caldisericia bacterium]
MRKKEVVAILLVFFVINLFSCKNSSINNKIPGISTIKEEERIIPSINDVVIKEKISQSIQWQSPYPFGIRKNFIPTRNETKSNDEVAISYASYPSFHGLPDKAIEKKVNQIIKGYIDNELKEFWNSISMGRNVYFSHYQILFIDENICSILFHRYGYRWTESYIMNIHLQEGKLLKPEDFFVKGYDYYPIMRAYCLKDLTEQRLSEGRDLTNMEGKLLYKFDFNVTANGFYAYFNEIFSHATGDYAVYIPFSIFGENCLLKPKKSLYGYFDCPDGWKYFDENNFLIKYPTLLDADGFVMNMTYNDEDDDGSNFNLNLLVQNTGEISFKIQQKNGWNAEPINKNDKEKLVNIDSVEFEKTQKSSETKDQVSQMITIKEDTTFRTILTKSERIEYNITISITSLPLKDQSVWEDQKEKLYYYVNQILSTFEL